ncbi:hypothetical protein ACFYSJ_01335 [Streptomyces sp. NPDC005248]|uniref:hypothetical protein n=1 Tax=unclassified Streptomyces TaxID=2593676 RepID=UPI0033A12CCE
MKDGFFHSYHLGWSRLDAESLLGDLGAAGLRLDHPATGRITLVSPGSVPPATQARVTWEQLVTVAGLQRLDEISFLLWVRSGAEVYARIRRTGGGVVALEFGLHGLSQDDQELAVRAIREAIGRASVLCIGFVVDREGASEATDWDGVIVNGTTFFDSWPDTLAVRHEVAAVQPQLSGVASFEQSPWKLFGSEVPSR